MFYTFGRILQLAGMAALILGSAGNMAEKISVSAMYQFLIGGVVLFAVGFVIQEKARR